MNERKKLKKQLGDKYIFKMYLSVNEVKKLLSLVHKLIPPISFVKSSTSSSSGESNELFCSRFS